jgi:rhodanese-related sulfurtransferase
MSVSSPQNTVTDLSPEAFVQSPVSPKLIDVRSGLEYSMFHAPQATNLSLPRILLAQVPLLRKWALPQWFRDLPKDEPVAVVCLTSHRSPIAAQAMAKMGFARVFNITGGMMDWQKAGLPTTKGKANPESSPETDESSAE